LTDRAQLAGAALALIFGTLTAALPARGEDAAAPAATQKWREATLAEYRQHLVDLGAIVDACAKARDTKACEPELVGQDDRVPLGNAPNAERRLVSYAWLRALLVKAQQKDEIPEPPQTKPQEKPQEPQQGAASDKANKADNASQDEDEDDSDEDAQSAKDDKSQETAKSEPVKTPAVGLKPAQPEEPARPPKPTTNELLEAAKARLTDDISQADAAASGAPAAAIDHAAQREAMKLVLAGRDFRNLEPQTTRDTFWEKVGEWLNRIWANVAKLHVHAVWFGKTVVWSFILAVCVGLVWGLMQLERRWSVRLVPESDGPAAGAASARDWQLWLKDARSCAAEGRWREAIHFIYWAAISRLESKRLWPADRARTPREYLALVAAEDPRKPRLAMLTGSFERIWYGGRAAAESDYLKAEDVAAGLISGGGSASAEVDKGGER